MAFPYTSQEIFVSIPQEGFAGFRYAADMRDELVAGFVPVVANVAQQTTCQFEFSTTDAVGIYIDGLGPYFVASDTSDTITADAWVTAYGALLVANGILASVPAENGSGLVTLVFADYEPHTVTAYSPATADVTPITNTVAAAQSDQIVFGQGITLADLPDLITEISVPIALPTAGTDKLKGVVAYTAANNYPNGLTSQVGAVAGFLVPGIAYQIVRKGRVMVKIIDTMPAKGAQVFWINDPTDPADLGHFRADTGGGGTEADAVAGSIVEGTVPGRSLAKVYFSQPLV